MTWLRPALCDTTSTLWAVVVSDSLKLEQTLVKQEETWEKFSALGIGYAAGFKQALVQTWHRETEHFTKLL